MELYANAASVSTTLGGGVHGHIGLVVDMSLHSVLSTTMYAAPTQPTRATLVATMVERQYTNKKSIHDNHNAAEEAVKTQIQDAIDGIYLHQLKNKFIRYMGVTSRDIIDHLFDQYGKITPSNI
eukprot:5037111-Ditylum_brightwellii.AAC.1